MIHRRILVSSAAGLLAFGLLAQAPPEKVGTRFRPELLRVEPYQAERAGALAAALGFAEWPRPSELYQAPAVGRVLFDEPAAVSEEVRACTTVPFNGEGWDQCVWSWQARGRREEGDAQAAGSLDVEITVAPSSRAAQEYLLTALADNMLPTEALVKQYEAAERPNGLGDAAVLVESPNAPDARLAFIRANVVFRIRGEGALSDRVLPLARRLDEGLLGQPSLTLEQLQARQRRSPPR
jgi:hypothetical protein